MGKKIKDIVKLGDCHRLHIGYHGAFLRNSNDYFIFKTCAPKIQFCLLKDPKGAFHPAENHFYFEIHKYPDDSKFIHSHLFPVCNRVPWVVDMENISFQLLGRAHVNERLMRKLHRDFFENPLYRKTFLAKIDLYSSPYCKGILYWSLAEIRDTIHRFKYYGIYDTSEVKNFMDKIILAYPAAKPLIRKVRLHNPRTIIFLARDFERKGGQIALATFKKLQEYDPDLLLIYCGPIPETYKQLYADLLKDIIYYPAVNHEQALYLLKQSDLLIFPTLVEAFGVTLIEAMAGGCVPMAYFGPEVAATPEIIRSNINGILLRRPDSIDVVREAKRFFKRIINLIHKDKVLVEMKQNALEEIIKGKFSFSRRIKLLKELFDQPMHEKKTGTSINLNKFKIHSYSAANFAEMMRHYRKVRSIPDRVFIKDLSADYEIA